MNVPNIQSLTPLRGIAALLVCVYHFHSKYVLTDEILKVTSFFSKGYLWVDFFFILSGFIMCHVYLKTFSSETSRVDYNKFIFSRFSRIYPLHIFIFSLLFVLEIGKLILLNAFQYKLGSEPFGQISPSRHRKLRSIIPTIFLLPNLGRWNPPAWSISAEFAMYLIFPFCLRFFIKGKSSQIFSKMTLLFLGLLVFRLFLEESNGRISGLHPSFNGWVQCFFEFFLGVLVYRVFKEDLLRTILGNNLFLVAVLISIAIIMHHSFNDIFLVPCFILLILSASYCKGFISNVLNTKAMIFLGDISYSVYLVHGPLMEICENLWELAFKTNLILSLSNTVDVGAIVVSFLFLSLVICAATLTHKYIEVPFKRRLKESQFSNKYIFT